jgi:hypothetical protein
MTLSEVAAGFAGSAEFTGRTAGMSHSDLVEFMYVNTLDRGSDAAGKAAWVDALDHGLSNGDLLLGFSESAEHYQLIQSSLYQGVEFLV